MSTRETDPRLRAIFALASLFFCEGCGSRTALGTPDDVNSFLADANSPSSTNDAGTAVIFGGFGVDNVERSDTWMWNGTSWREVSDVGPARFYGAMASVNFTLLFYGGTDHAGDIFSDTWLWKNGAWQSFAGSSADTYPPARYQSAMATLGETIVLFGGLQAGFGVSDTLGDTSIWDGKWTEANVVGPPARFGAAMAALENKIVLSGGVGENDDALTDTWTWNGAAWDQIDVAGPPARFGAAMASLDGHVILFGGTGGIDEGTALSDTWSWDGSAWSEPHVSGPPARTGAMMTPFGQTLVLFGGLGLPQMLSDTWIWNGKAWTQRAIAGPPARADGVAATL